MCVCVRVCARVCVPHSPWESKARVNIYLAMNQKGDRSAANLSAMCYSKFYGIVVRQT